MENWSRVVGLNEGLAPIGHLDRTAGITRQGSVRLVDRFGAHVVLANPCRSITGRRHPHRQTFYVVIGTKVMVGVQVSVLGIGMIVDPGQDDRTTGTATGRRAERLGKTHSVLGQLIQVGSFYHGIPVTSCIGTLIISDKQDNIAVSGCQRRP